MHMIGLRLGVELILFAFSATFLVYSRRPIWMVINNRLVDGERDTYLNIPQFDAFIASLQNLNLIAIGSRNMQRE